MNPKIFLSDVCIGFCFVASWRKRIKTTDVDIGSEEMSSPRDISLIQDQRLGHIQTVEPIELILVEFRNVIIAQACPFLWSARHHAVPVPNCVDILN